MDKLDNRAAPRDGFLALQILFFLRFIQLGSTVLTGFIACYLVWWHDRLHDKVPLGLIIVICTVSCCSAYILLKSPGLLYNLVLRSSTRTLLPTISPLACHVRSLLRAREKLAPLLTIISSAHSHSSKATSAPLMPFQNGTEIQIMDSYSKPLHHLLSL